MLIVGLPLVEDDVITMKKSDEWQIVQVIREIRSEQCLEQMFRFTGDKKKLIQPPRTNTTLSVDKVR